MPEYLYRDEETGEVVGVIESMRETPPIGEVVERGGRRFKKLPSTGVTGLDRTAKPFVAYSQVKWHPEAKKYTKHGHAVFESARERNEFIDRHNARADKTGGDKIAWDQ